MNKLILTADAKHDLAEIKRYITDQLQNSGAALRIVASITKELRTLRQYPQMGRSLEADLGVDGYRMLVCGKYLAFYRINGNEVQVDRILYGRRDYLAMLFGDEMEEEDGAE